MVRQKLKDNLIGMNREFEYRGEEQTRIETFSDAVFALAVTLLILSSTIPSTYAELKQSFLEIVPFAITITLLMLIWYQHYMFFIRYGFKDVKIVAVNTILLFLVLVYVYPLKFLFNVLFQMMYAGMVGDQALLKKLFTETLLQGDASSLMVIYGFGATVVFMTLAWMYKIAVNRRESLKLSAIELFHTKTSFYNNLFMASVPMLSALVALFNIGGDKYSFMLSGISYWCYIIALPLFHSRRAKVKKKLFG